MVKKVDISQFLKGILNSYSQVFFSDNRIFSVILLVVTFVDLYAGMFGLISVICTNLAGYLLGLDRRIITRGLYGFNSLLVGLGLSVYYSPDILLLVIVILGSFLTLFISVSMQGVIGKYALPYLSVPFLISIWIATLATREFTALGISERGIYTFNDLYMIGGDSFVRIYEWWNGLQIFRSLRIYLISLGAIFFQYNLLSGIIIAIGLINFSRISFTLSLVGFYAAYIFYDLVGADISELNYSYIGFNYILTSIALGGFFIIPSVRSHIWVLILIPLVALITISSSSIFVVFKLPVYSLPFNIIVLLFLYVLKFRIKPSQKLSEVFIQQNSPEKNLYSFHNDRIRFRHNLRPVKLPFYGEWTVAQAHDGEHTHKEAWKHAWDFIITDGKDKQFSGSGDLLTDYYCYDKNITAPSDGTIEHIVDNIPDNTIGDVNIKENWGNTVIIKISDQLYASLSHLKPGSIKVKAGDQVKEGEIIARCGNSGRSPYPHLHFQLQATPYIGSPTLLYPFSYYILKKSDEWGLCQFEIPETNNKVSNIETNELLNNAFNLVPGKILHLETTTNEEKVHDEWEIKSDEYNNTFIESHGSGSKIYFTNDGNLLWFKHFEGKRNTLLYYFFIAAFKIQLGYYQDLALTDQFPVNLIFRRIILFFQDFLAPFRMFLLSSYRVKYDYIDNEISPSKIILKSTATNSVFGKTIGNISVSIEINEQGIHQFEVNTGKKSFVTTCSES
ncbi:MAG: urea transporter [Bacteroidales bacterium]|nr:urea transporter [Bacteroidales bacterium]